MWILVVGTFAAVGIAGYWFELTTSGRYILMACGVGGITLTMVVTEMVLRWKERRR